MDVHKILAGPRRKVVGLAGSPVGVGHGLAARPDERALHRDVVESDPQTSVNHPSRRKRVEHECILGRVIDGHEMPAQRDGCGLRVGLIGLLQQVILMAAVGNGSLNHAQSPHLSS